MTHSRKLLTTRCNLTILPAVICQIVHQRYKKLDAYANPQTSSQLNIHCPVNVIRVATMRFL